MPDRRVLLVEHDWRMRHFLRANLEALGLTVIPAVSGAHALQLLDGYRPHLVLVDVDEPGLELRAWAGEVRARRGAEPLPVILMSHEATARQGWAEPGALFLEKPFGAPELLDQVRKALNW